MYTRKSLLGLWVFREQKSKSRVRTPFFLTKCRRKTKSLFFEEKLSPGVLDLCAFFSNKIIFSIFEKDALRLRSYIFETFRFAPRKISR